MGRSTLIRLMEVDPDKGVVAGAVVERGDDAVAKINGVTLVGRPRNTVYVRGIGPGLMDIAQVWKVGQEIASADLRRELRKADEIWVRYTTSYGEEMA